MPALTQKQLLVLKSIALLHSQEGRPPTIREIAAYLGRHPKTVYQHIRALERKHKLEKRKGRVYVAQPAIPFFRTVRRTSSLLSKTRAYARSKSGWFEDSPNYVGNGILHFEAPSGQTMVLEGPSRIVVNRFGDAQINVEVSTKEGYSLQGFDPLTLTDFGLFQGQQFKLKEFELKGKGYRVHTLGKDHHFAVNSSSAEDLNVEIHPLSFVCEATTRKNPKYWVIPLVNFVSEFVDAPRVVASHKLRIDPDCSVIMFRYLGEIGFIEPLEGYRHIADDLVNGTLERCVTSLMIGEHKIFPDERISFEKWPPADYPLLLSFATGRSVGFPWVEFRDVNGQLVRRIHLNDSDCSFAQKGQEAINQKIHKGIGLLATNAGASGKLGQRYLRVALKQVMRTGFADGQLETAFKEVCGVLDGLCNHVNIADEELRNSLGPADFDELRKVLVQAQREIGPLTKKAKRENRPDAERALRAIADRVGNNVHGKSGCAGARFAKLIDHYGLRDLEIVAPYYSDKETDWCREVTEFRNDANHGCSFSEKNVDSVWRLLRHLHDLAVRIILKEVRYEGCYQPVTITRTSAQKADWVTEKTRLWALGYGE